MLASRSNNESHNQVDGGRKLYSAALAMIVVGSNFRSYFFFFLESGYSIDVKAQDEIAVYRAEVFSYNVFGSSSMVVASAYADFVVNLPEGGSKKKMNGTEQDLANEYKGRVALSLGLPCASRGRKLVKAFIRQLEAKEPTRRKSQLKQKGFAFVTEDLVIGFWTEPMLRNSLCSQHLLCHSLLTEETLSVRIHSEALSPLPKELGLEASRSISMRVTKALGLSSWSCGSLLFPMLVFVSDRTISKALGSGSVLLTGFGRATGTATAYITCLPSRKSVSDLM
ncbi:hypothetical protein VNO80_33796 [Phaseolus coccineus]|uniref:Uncharacterized protein n=1 Tax=Phaseolus coccineus TaxID=3886 RepID=A0AAN9KYP1_PHACN